MENQSILLKAKELAKSLNETDVQAELYVLKTFMEFSESNTLLSDFRPSGSKYSYKLNRSIIPFILFIREKYQDECKCLTIFLKVIQIFYGLDMSKEDNILTSDLAGYIFHQEFQRLKDVKVPHNWN